MLSAKTYVPVSIDCPVYGVVGSAGVDFVIVENVSVVEGVTVALPETAEVELGFVEDVVPFAIMYAEISPLVPVV